DVDYNRDGDKTDRQLAESDGGIDYNGDGDKTDTLSEAADGKDYNEDGDKTDTLAEADVNPADFRLSKGTACAGRTFIDIHDPDPDNTATPNRLTFGELTSTPFNDLFNAGIAGQASADLHLAADLSDATLPNITTDLTLDWNIGLT